MTSKPDTAFEGGSASPAPQGHRSAIALHGRVEGRGEIFKGAEQNVRNQFTATLKSAFIFSVCKKVSRVRRSGSSLSVLQLLLFLVFRSRGLFVTDVQAVAVRRNVKTETRVSYWCSRHPVSECRRQLSTLWPLSAQTNSRSSSRFPTTDGSLLIYLEGKAINENHVAPLVPS